MANGAYNVHYWVKDIPSIIFWFRAIAGGNEAPDGFTIDRDWQPVDRIIARHQPQTACSPTSTARCSSLGKGKPAV